MWSLPETDDDSWTNESFDHNHFDDFSENIFLVWATSFHGLMCNLLTSLGFIWRFFSGIWSIGANFPSFQDGLEILVSDHWSPPIWSSCLLLLASSTTVVQLLLFLRNSSQADRSVCHHCHHCHLQEQLPCWSLCLSLPSSSLRSSSSSPRQIFSKPNVRSNGHLIDQWWS